MRIRNKKNTKKRGRKGESIGRERERERERDGRERDGRMERAVAAVERGVEGGE